MSNILNYILGILGAVIAGIAINRINITLQDKREYRIKEQKKKEIFLEEMENEIDHAINGNFFRVINNFDKIENKLAEYINITEQEKLNEIHNIREAEREEVSLIKTYPLGLASCDKNLSRAYKNLFHKIIKRLKNDRKFSLANTKQS